MLFNAIHSKVQVARYHDYIVIHAIAVRMAFHKPKITVNLSSKGLLRFDLLRSVFNDVIWRSKPDRTASETRTHPGEK